MLIVMTITSIVTLLSCDFYLFVCNWFLLSTFLGYWYQWHVRNYKEALLFNFFYLPAEPSSLGVIVHGCIRCVAWTCTTTRPAGAALWWGLWPPWTRRSPSGTQMSVFNTLVMRLSTSSKSSCLSPCDTTTEYVIWIEVKFCQKYSWVTTLLQ